MHEACQSKRPCFQAFGRRSVCRGVPRAQPIATPMSLTLSPEPGLVARGRVGDPCGCDARCSKVRGMNAARPLPLPLSKSLSQSPSSFLAAPDRGPRGTLQVRAAPRGGPGARHPRPRRARPHRAQEALLRRDHRRGHGPVSIGDGGADGMDATSDNGLRRIFSGALFGAGEIHVAELAYWMNTSDPDTENWWPIAEALLARWDRHDGRSSVDRADRSST